MLRVKLALGLFEHPFVDEGAAPKVLYQPESITTATSAPSFGISMAHVTPTTPGRIWLQTLPIAKLAHALAHYMPNQAPRQAVEGGVVGGIVGSILDGMK